MRNTSFKSVITNLMEENPSATTMNQVLNFFKLGVLLKALDDKLLNLIEATGADVLEEEENITKSYSTSELDLNVCID